MIRRLVPTLLALGGVLAAGAHAAAAEGLTGGAPRVLLDAGTLYLWDRAAPNLSPFPAGLLPGDAPPLAVVDPGDDRGVLILRAAPDTGERGRKKLEGEALLVAWSALSTASNGLALAWTARFEGLPRAATATAGRAWVLTRQATDSQPGSGRNYIQELDRRSGRIEDSTILPEPAAALATDPLGRRLYAALENRILSLTTRPLITSWHHRSPGKNGALVVSPSGTILAAARGHEVAFFDATAIASRPAAERRDRQDDATTVTPLPLAAETLAFSGDGKLLVAFGAGGMVFIETSTGSVIWPETAAPLSGASVLLPLSFPGAGRDLIVAALPAQAVAALPAPEVRGGAEVAAAPAPPAPVGAPPPAPVADVVPPIAPPESAPAGHADAGGALEPGPSTTVAPPVAPPPATAAPAAAAAPESAAPAPEATVPAAPTTASEPAPDTDGPPVLSGTIAGDRARARAVVLYGPDSIIKEFARVTPDAAGGWRVALPPPGVYRVVAIGDGSTPIPAAPAFRTVKVVAGEAQGGVDFTIGAAPVPATAP